MAGFVSKVRKLPHISTVIATRGAMPTLNLISIEISREFVSFDDLLQRGSSILREAYECGDLEYGSCFEDHFDLVCVGWSTDSERTEAYAMSSFDHPGLDPFTFVRHDLIIAPQPAACALDGAGITRVGEFVGDFRPARDLLRIMELQRLTPGPTGSDSEVQAYVVGGAAILTEVTRDVISQRVVRRWQDDRVGEAIRLAENADVHHRRLDEGARAVAG